MYSNKLTQIIFITSFIFSQDPEQLLSQGESKLASGGIDEAESLFNDALKVDPSFAPALKALSKLNLHKGDLKKGK